MHPVLERLGEIRIVPVIALEDAAQAAPLARALAEGGLPAAEVTFRTPAAEEALRRITATPAAGTALTTMIRDGSRRTAPAILRRWRRTTAGILRTIRRRGDIKACRAAARACLRSAS